MLSSRILGLVALAALLAGCAADGARPGSRERLAKRADVSAVVAADLALARLAREKGQWQAFREKMGDDAVMFVPYLANAREWLSRQEEPAQPALWRPERVVSSCDGTLAASMGGATWPDGTFSRYLTVWKRERNGSYRWVLDTGEPTREAPDPPEMIGSTVAECAPPPPAQAAALSVASRASDDQTFRYAVSQEPGGGDALEVSYWTGETFEVFYRRPVPAAPPQ